VHTIAIFRLLFRICHFHKYSYSFTHTSIRVAPCNISTATFMIQSTLFPISKIFANYKFKIAIYTHIFPSSHKHTNHTPSHQGILGNEQADAAARFMSTAPTLLFTPTSAKDIFRLITSTNKEKLKSDWEGIIHRYNTLNPAREKTTFPTDLNKHDRRIYTRLRIGHTQETHEHLLQGLAPPPCRFCGGIISSIEHLLDTCQALNHTRFSIFGSVTVPSSLLTSPSIPNIKKLKEYITTVHLRI